MRNDIKSWLAGVATAALLFGVAYWIGSSAARGQMGLGMMDIMMPEQLQPCQPMMGQMQSMMGNSLAGRAQSAQMTALSEADLARTSQ